MKQIVESFEGPEARAKARGIAGNPNGIGGVNGSIWLGGADAQALIEALNFTPAVNERFMGHPVRISRNGLLELWCDGFYHEGPRVRRIVAHAFGLKEREASCSN